MNQFNLSAVEFLYCFANASLTQRVLVYLLRQRQTDLSELTPLLVDCVTVIFFNDRWVMHLQLNQFSDVGRCDDCWAFLNENGLPYHPPIAITRALDDLEAGYPPTAVMNRHHVAIVSHGVPSPNDVRCFQEEFVAGLGYRPQSLV